MDDYINRFQSEQEIYKPTQTIRVGRMDSIQKNDIPTTKIENDKSKQPNTENKANPANKKKKTAEKETRDMEKSNSDKPNKNKKDQPKTTKIATPETITKPTQKQGDKDEIVDLKTTEKNTLKEKMKTYAQVAKNAKQGDKQQKYRKYVLAFDMAD